MKSPQLKLLVEHEQLAVVDVVDSGVGSLTVGAGAALVLGVVIGSVSVSNVLVGAVFRSWGLVSASADVSSGVSESPVALLQAPSAHNPRFAVSASDWDVL